MEKNNKKILQFFSALSDETRFNILLTLVDGSKSVGEIYKIVGDNITLSAVSHQLRKLEDSEVVISKKQGREKFFELSGYFCWCMLRDAIKHFQNKKLRRKK